MGHKAQAQEIADTGVMVNGIKANQDVLAQRKIDIAFANALQADVDACIALNTEQETLKAKLKEKTEEFDGAFTAMLKKAGEARKIIKMDMPQSSWREFGINDKR
ncbi:MAG: hypothetical protein LBG45_00305 [Dysgonamonadaceae bacterium]|jgi:hypothetical protein|nr:hypothetical protein [Dysgonamonadaceae bacterium]